MRGNVANADSLSERVSIVDLTVGFTTPEPQAGAGAAPHPLLLGGEFYTPNERRRPDKATNWEAWDSARLAAHNPLYLAS